MEKTRKLVGKSVPLENRSNRNGPPGKTSPPEHNPPGKQPPGVPKHTSIFNKIQTPNIRGHEMDDRPAFRAPSSAEMMPGATGSRWDQF